jgi:tetratricopeptide (TPR) repeat protein
VQRLAVLAAFFFLLCLWSYFKARTAASLTARVAFATLFVTSGVAAINTKENTVMLPAVLFLIEWLLFRVWRERWYVLPPIAMALVAGLLYLLAPDLWVRIDTLTRETPDITRIEYWQAQWVVLWVYVQKIVTFSGYKLEYALSTADFSQVLIITAGLAHFIVLMGAWYFRRALPLITLGIYFFYVTHFVESGLIPIRDIAFEHRNYLPLFGLVLAFFAALHAAVLKWVPRERWRGKQSLVFATIVFFACYATHARNELWADQGAFLQHEARENPDHVRSQHSLAVWYSQQGEYRKALTILWRLFTVSREFNPSVVSSYVGILIQLDDYTKALEVLEMILPQEVGRRPSFGPMYSYLGSIRYQYQQYAEAAAAFEQARLRMVLDENSLVQYILSLIKLNELDRAQQIHALIIELYPDGGGTRGVTTLLQGVLEKSRAGAD